MSLRSLLHVTLFLTSSLLWIGMTYSPDANNSSTNRFDAPAMAPPPLCGGNLGENILPNGDFGSGTDNVLQIDPGYSGLQTYSFAPSPPEGFYTVTNNTTSWGGINGATWIDIGDNSPDPEGYMMVVNAFALSGVFYDQTVDICEETTYEISMDAINIYDPNLPVGAQPNLEIIINGTALLNTGNLPQDATWQTFNLLYTSMPGETSLTLEIRNNTPGGIGGNDFALDNVLIQACGPEAILVETFPSLKCPGDSLDLVLTVGPEYPNPFMQYQVSTDGENTWTDLGAPTDQLQITIPSVPDNAAYRALVASSLPNLLSGSCSVLTNVQPIFYTNINNCFTSPVLFQGLLCNGSLGENAVIGGDFGTGPDPFGPPLPGGATSYQYNNDTFPNDGFYSLVNDFNFDPCLGFFPESCWIPFQDNSADPEGYCLVVNADVEPGLFYTQEINDLCENTTYQFSADILNVNAPFFFPGNPLGTEVINLPNIDFIVAPTGTPNELTAAAPALYNTGDILNDSTWNTYGFTFTTGPGVTDIILALRNNAPGGDGNAIDNIEIRPCGAFLDIINDGFVCDGYPLDLEVSVTGNGVDPVFLQWQQSADGLVWNNLPGEDATTLNIPVPTAGEQYRVIGATDPALLSSPFCHVISEPIVVTILPNSQTAIDTMICPGEIVTVGSSMYSVPGNYTDVLVAANGCDSTVNLTLGLLLVPSTILQETICEGEDFQVGTSTYILPGNYIDTLVAANGCDSIIFLDLEVLQAFQTFEEVVLCDGDLYNGVSYDNDTTLTFQLSSVDNCDSTVFVNILVSELSEVEIFGDTLICDGESTVLSVGQFETYDWSTGSNNQSINVGEAGIYEVVVSDELGCTADTSVNLSVIELEMFVTGRSPSCPGIRSGSISIDSVLGGKAPYLYTLNDRPFTSDPRFQELGADTFLVTVQDAFGCTLTEPFILEDPVPLELSIGEDRTINLGDTAQLNYTASFEPISLQWSPDFYLNCSDCDDPIAVPLETTTFQLLALDEEGCAVKAEVTIFLGKTRFVYIPNTFSPDNDGINDVFTIYGGEDVVSVARLMIFDRWGSLLYQRDNFAPNDENGGWDGRYPNGLEAAQGVYPYFCLVQFIDGRIRRYEGGIMIIR